MAHRTDGANHVANAFSDGGAGVPGTTVEQAWLNMVQEELCGLIEAAGITLVKGTYTQLTAAVAAYIATHNAVTNPHSATAAATASRLMLRDAAGRAAVADPSAAGDIDTKGARDAAIAAAFTTGTITPAANWTLTADLLTKRPGAVTVRFKAVAAAGATWGSIATLPAGYRPLTDFLYAPCVISASAGGQVAGMLLSTNGTVGVFNAFGGTLDPPAIGVGNSVWLTVTFPI